MKNTKVKLIHTEAVGRVLNQLREVNYKIKQARANKHRVSDYLYEKAVLEEAFQKAKDKARRQQARARRA